MDERRLLLKIHPLPIYVTAPAPPPLPSTLADLLVQTLAPFLIVANEHVFLIFDIRGFIEYKTVASHAWRGNRIRNAVEV
jgi:hypothetical protein